MIDTKKLQELDQEYDQNLRNIYRNREQLEDDFHLFMARTDSLKESVYQATLGQGWELPQEAHAHLYNMDDNKDTFISEFNEYMEKLEEKEIDLRRVYNDRVDELYQKAKQNEAKKGSKFFQVIYINMKNKESCSKMSIYFSRRTVTTKSLKSQNYLVFKLMSNTQTLLNQCLLSLKSAQ